jgi:hypothetical protein
MAGQAQQIVLPGPGQQSPALFTPSRLCRLIETLAVAVMIAISFVIAIIDLIIYKDTNLSLSLESTFYSVLLSRSLVKAMPEEQQGVLWRVRKCGILVYVLSYSYYWYQDICEYKDTSPSFSLTNTFFLVLVSCHLVEEMPEERQGVLWKVRSCGLLVCVLSYSYYWYQEMFESGK